VTFNRTAGLGVEFSLGGPFTGKFEYHTSTSCTVPCGGNPVGIGVSENVFRVGLNYRVTGW
jgi:opacity protein-like surface antigen